MKQKTNQGFTIIEVVLVLAIAGLIFLMVFIAVPALQRNQRDTDRRNVYSGIGTGITNFRSKNNGRLPNQNPASPASFAQPRGDRLCTVARSAGDVQDMTNCTTTNTTTPVQFRIGSTTYQLWIRNGAGTINFNRAAFTNAAMNPGLTGDNVNKVLIVTNARCGEVNTTDNHVGTVTVTADNNRSVVIGPIEAGNTVTCLNVD